MIVSDVDNTLISQNQYNERKRFTKKITNIRDKIVLVYSSGRFCKSVMETLFEFPELTKPDYVVGGVGTEIFDYNNNKNIDVSRIFNTTWNYDLTKQTLLDLKFQLQPQEFQSKFKISFTVEPDSDPVSKVRSVLNRAHLEANVVYSSDRDLDVIPKGAGKGNIIKYLQKIEKIPDTSVIVAGDSMNDKSMFDQEFKGIIVANASSKLKNLGSELNYLSNQPAILGVLDGLNHWGLFHDLQSEEMVKKN